MAKKPIAKAQGKPVHQAWLILSNQKERFDEKLALIDLFLPDTQLSSEPNKDRAKIKLAQLLWEALNERGFRINASLEHQYQKQLTCIWCGGPVMTIGNSDPENPSWEVRCADCGYIYDED